MFKIEGYARVVRDPGKMTYITDIPHNISVENMVHTRIESVKLEKVLSHHPNLTNSFVL
ncbi:hypothetical protein F511_45001 [Dorcoceras hygrometricum]|uniref:Uncharacterized protein n=1 Tax=Dorcoceras hygrometricum TaxID=472368 RepID=A0A2Z6ZX13_9LAMI|nr:hypothetical protein F511_45001 [Dorcoceras hygrometricum]